MKTVLLIFLSLTALPTWSADEPLAFKGLALGVSEDEVKARYPDAGCSDARRAVGGRYCIVDRTIAACVTRKSAGRPPCPGDFTECRQRGLSIDECSKLQREVQLTVAGVKVEWVRFSFWDGKLGEIWLRISTKPVGGPVDHYFTKISTAYLDVFGKPTRDVSTPVTTRAGVPHEDRRLTWERPDGRLELIKYAGAIDVSSITYRSPAAIEAERQGAEAERKKAASDL